MVLRRITVPKREELTGGWRKLCKEELYTSYSTKYLGDQTMAN
jgi:hypothetical protein